MLANGGQRLYTVLIYLNDVPEGSGGCTFFPYARGKNAHHNPNIEGGGGLRVRPQRGSAIIFFPSKHMSANAYTASDGVLFPPIRQAILDENALHCAESVDGHKFVMQIWVREGEVCGVGDCPLLKVI
jgi:hypothetical protein